MPGAQVELVENTTNYSFTGAAGSGKSTIIKNYLTDEQKTDYVVLATDNYRAFTLPDTDAHEEKSTRDIFTRTQDMAYLVKELVLEEIDEQIKQTHTRPNILCDCITLDKKMLNYLSDGTVHSYVAAYRGEPGYVGIAERADNRANDLQAGPADKGRFVNTNSLFEGHADASKRLISTLPNNTITKIYNTAVEKGKDPIEIATVDSNKHVVDISDLRVMSEFLNKSNVNINAVNPVDLILKKGGEIDAFANHPEYKAKAILELIPKSKYKEAYTVRLKENNDVYAELRADKNGKITLDVLNKKLFFNKENSNSVEAAVLRALIRQVLKGDIVKSFNSAYSLPKNKEAKLDRPFNSQSDNKSFIAAYNKIKFNNINNETKEDKEIERGNSKG